MIITGFNLDCVECFTLYGQPFCNLEVLVRTLKKECTFTCYNDGWVYESLIVCYSVFAICIELSFDGMYFCHNAFDFYFYRKWVEAASSHLLKSLKRRVSVQKSVEKVIVVQEVKRKMYAKLHVPNFTHLLSRKGFEVFHDQLKTMYFEASKTNFQF